MEPGLIPYSTTAAERLLNTIEASLHVIVITRKGGRTLLLRKLLRSWLGELSRGNIFASAFGKLTITSICMGLQLITNSTTAAERLLVKLNTSLHIGVSSN